MIKEVTNSVVRWKEGAKKIGLKKGEIDRLSSAFEHEDLRKAQKL